VALAFPAARRFLGLGRTSGRLAVCHGSPQSRQIASEQLPADGWWREGRMSKRAAGGKDDKDYNLPLKRSKK
jgi:hypothetical protein